MDIDTLTRTAGSVADPTPGALDLARADLDRATHAAALRVAAIRRSRRRRGAGVLVGAAAAGALLAVPVLTAAPASAQAVLLRAAAAAGEQSHAAAGATWWYVESQVDDPATVPHRREIWRGRDAHGVLRDEYLAAERAQADGAGVVDPALVRTESLGPNEGGEPSDVFVVGGHAFTWDDLEALPTEADELRTVLRARVEDHPAGSDDQLWEGAVSLLQESPASPELRRALWEVVATIPDVELLGSATDALGRTGTAVELDRTGDGWYRQVLVLDPSAGTLLEVRAIDAAGTTVHLWTLVEQRPTDVVPDPAPPVCGPGSASGESC